MDAFTTQWQAISTNSNFETKRLRVPGGWIVSVRYTTTDTVEIVFVADPQGQWVLET